MTQVEPYAAPGPSARAARSLAFWAANLRDAPAATVLPSTALAGRVSADQAVARELPEELTRRLREATGGAAPPSLLLVAAFLIVVGRHSGQDDLVISFVDHSRPRARPVLLRMVLRGDPTFRRLVAMVSNALHGAYLHDDVPHEVVIDRILGGRASAHGLAPQVGIAFEWNAWEGSPTSSPRDGRAGIPVRLVAGQNPTGTITCALLGHPEPTLAEGLLQRYELLLAEIAARPRTPIGALRVLTGEERARFDTALAKLAEGEGEGEGRGLAARWRAQVHRVPERVALSHGSTRLTYTELDDWAERLCARLRLKGLGPGRRIGLLAGPGASAVAGTLAIWKAGAALVALAPDDDEARLGHVTRSARLDLVLCETGGDDRLDPALPTLAIGERDVLRPLGVRPAAAEVQQRDLACIFYGAATSPAPGVMLTHAAVHNLASGLGGGAHHSPDPERPRNVCLDAAPCDDRFLRQLVGLLNGHTLWVAPAMSGGRVGAVLEALRTAMVDIVDLPMLDGLTEDGLIDGLGCVLRQRPSGAPAPVLVLGWRAGGMPSPRLEPGRILVVHGPPEACFGALVEVTSDGPGANPVGALACFVLDHRGQPVPDGVVGQLHLGGPGLARGYYDRSIVDTRFVNVSLPGGWRARLFRSGERARWLPDGRVQLLGDDVDDPPA